MRLGRILMMAALVALSAWFFSMSDHLSPFTLITVPLGIIFFSAAVGAAFGHPDRGAQVGLGVLVVFLGILAFTGSGVVSLAITAAVVATVCASLVWHRKDVHGR